MPTQIAYAQRQLDTFTAALGQLGTERLERLSAIAADSEYVCTCVVEGDSGIIMHFFPQGTCDVYAYGAPSTDAFETLAFVCASTTNLWSEYGYATKAPQEAFKALQAIHTERSL